MSNTPEVCNELVSNAIEAETGFPVESLKTETRLRDIGIESVLSVGIVERLEKHFGPLSKSLMLEFDTLGSLVTHLGQTGACSVPGAGSTINRNELGLRSLQAVHCDEVVGRQ